MIVERAPIGTLTDPALRAAWDQRAVAAPGGDMHQGAAFAADRARRSIRTLPLYVDGAPLLVCIRSLPFLGLSVASIPRGPAAPTDALRCRASERSRTTAARWGVATEGGGGG